MKEIIVYASGGFSDRGALVDGLLMYCREHKLGSQSICLLTPHKHTWLRHSCIDIALDNELIFHSSVTANSAERLRTKLCNKAEGALIFWDGRSAGTRKLIDKVEKLDIPFAVHIV